MLWPIHLDRLPTGFRPGLGGVQWAGGEARGAGRDVLDVEGFEDRRPGHAEVPAQAQDRHRKGAVVRQPVCLVAPDPERGSGRLDVEGDRPGPDLIDGGVRVVIASPRLLSVESRGAPTCGCVEGKTVQADD
jgi:hypothetical protein